ncbi:hypothetical protein ACF1AE_00155 [Streptomyces sp. NPDC014986]|uniref:hypothetical protein n=1 Tax=Streptomyces sp. NPDC014986 TaxID=3364934 RepID=UPI0036FF6DB1
MTTERREGVATGGAGGRGEVPCDVPCDVSCDVSCAPEADGRSSSTGREFFLNGVLAPGVFAF